MKDLTFEDLPSQGSEEHTRQIVSVFERSGFATWPEPESEENTEENVLYYLTIGSAPYKLKRDMILATMLGHSTSHTKSYQGYLKKLESKLKQAAGPSSDGRRKTSAGGSHTTHLQDLIQPNPGATGGMTSSRKARRR